MVTSFTPFSMSQSSTYMSTCQIGGATVRFGCGEHSGCVVPEKNVWLSNGWNSTRWQLEGTLQWGLKKWYDSIKRWFNIYIIYMYNYIYTHLFACTNVCKSIHIWGDSVNISEVLVFQDPNQLADPGLVKVCFSTSPDQRNLDLVFSWRLTSYLLW